MKMHLSIYIVMSCSLLAACGGGGSSTSPVQPSANTEQSVAAISSSSSSVAESAYLIGGTISGLLGSGLVLQNNNGDDITINGDGNFYFSTKLANKKTYVVRVKTRPATPAQTCRVENYKGVINSAQVTNINVICTINSAIALGQGSSYIIRADGTLWAWGLNDYGQLGDGSTESLLIPKQIGIDTDWNAISVGKDYVLALKRDGSLWSWGFGKFGQLGNGGSASLSVPTRVGADTNWLSVSAAYSHAAAVKTDGTLWGWGAAIYGAPIRNQPTQIEGADYIKVAAGYNHTLAIKQDGSLWGWGGNKFGSVGDGTTASSAVPMQIGESKHWETIFAEYENSIAFQKNGSAWVWGANLASNPTSQFLPSQFGATSEWKAIVSGGLVQQFSAAIKFDGTLWAWGVNYHGQMGQGALNASGGAAPVQIGSSNQWVAVALGAGEHVLALKSDGTLWGWGENSNGQLGDGTTTDKYVPTQITFSTH
jgi:alpha-tubulin suppressor-like RCC1 family protein